MQNKKVAIAGLWHRHDYGSILGCYSLYKFIDNSGFSPVLMNKPKDLWGENEKYEDENSVAGKFIYPRCEVLPVFTSEQDYENLNNDCDIFVTGGDNVWDYSLCGSSGQYFYLDFVANNKIKIAYDSGFNGNCIPRDIKESINRYIKGFTAISVSEKESTDFLKREFGVKADAVINSFFLNTRGMYDEIAEYSRYLYNKNQNKFTVVIVQSGSAVINNLIRRTEEKYEIPAIVFHNPDKPEEKSIFSNDGFIVSEYTAVEDYVWAVKNAEYVISDSIQAICLAIIFNKPFVAVTSRFAVDHVCFEELLKKFALGYKIYNTDDYTVNYESILDSQINYNPVNNFIDYTRTLSQNWLINALNKNSFEIENESSGVVNYQHFEKKQVYKQTLYKIQNLIFPDCEWKDKHQEMLYRGVKMIYDPGRKSWNIPVGGVVECFTYFNSLSIKKWIKYTTADKFYLHLKIKGSFKIHFFGHYIETPIDKKGNSIPVEETLNKIKEMDINRTHFIYRAVDNGIIKKEIFEERSFRFDEPNELILPVLYDKASVVGIFLTANSECEIFDGYYSAVCFEQLLNPVDISIVSCTFQKEEYVKQNINILKNEIILSGKQGGCDEIFEHIFVNIVDNGRTLIPEEHEGYRLKIYPNPNAGGAGGFTRGMMETIKRSEWEEFKATHVLLMDDDVIILPESIKRTYALLRFIKNEYKDYFIAGAMLRMDEMNVQHEDGGFMTKYVNLCHSQKPVRNMNLWDNVLKNEQDYTQDNAYAAWWYCCTPIKLIRRDNLSLPLFFRTDDIEFGLRNKAKLITMNGIWIWHMEFNSKYNAATDMYLAFRNFLFIQAVSGVAEDCDFIAKIKKIFFLEIRKFNYISADLLLDAVEDFLKGPEFFATVNGENLIKQYSAKAKNEKMLPIEKFRDMTFDINKAYEYIRLNEQDMEIFINTNNGHELPDELLLDDDIIPEISFDDQFESPYKQFLRKKILVINVSAKTIGLREMDKEEYRRIMDRYNEIMQRYEVEKEDVTEKYKDSAKEFKSFDFWQDYLGLDDTKI